MKRLSSRAADVQAKALAAELSGGFFEVMTGDPPKDDEFVAEEFRLSSCELGSTPFAAPKDGIMQANVIAKAIAIRKGEPTWFRLVTKDGFVMVQGLAHEMGLTVDMFVAGQIVSIKEYTHRVVRDID